MVCSLHQRIDAQVQGHETCSKPPETSTSCSVRVWPTRYLPRAPTSSCALSTRPSTSGRQPAGGGSLIRQPSGAESSASSSTSRASNGLQFLQLANSGPRKINDLARFRHRAYCMKSVRYGVDFKGVISGKQAVYEPRGRGFESCRARQ